MSFTRAQRAPPARATRPVTALPRVPEVIVVTHDADLERALRAAVPSTPMRVATTPAALADLLMTGRAGALVLDLVALDTAALTVARHLAEQFPDVPLVTVGSREDEARLAGLISRGLIYRFLHRPVSAARARTFMEAALRRSAEVGSAMRSATAPAAPRAPAGYRPLFALAVAGATVALGLGFWLGLRPPPATAARNPSVTVAAGSLEPDAAPPVTVASPAVATAAPSAPVASTPRAEPPPAIAAVRPAALEPPAPVEPPPAAAAPVAVEASADRAIASDPEVAPPDEAVSAPPASALALPPSPEPAVVDRPPPDGA